MAVIYAAIGIVVGIIGSRLSPNANSLHRLYRERINKTFLSLNVPEIPKMEALQPQLGPYHLVNAAVNLQDSRRSNERGRNADFFMFSPNRVVNPA